MFPVLDEINKLYKTMYNIRMVLNYFVLSSKV